MDDVAHRTMLHELRLAFASGRAAAGEELLAQALNSGLPWDLVTRAVAEGVAHCYGTRLLSEEETGGNLALA